MAPRHTSTPRNHSVSLTSLCRMAGARSPQVSTLRLSSPLRGCRLQAQKGLTYSRSSRSPLPIALVINQLVKPGAMGGSDRVPTSFNPHLGLAYIGGMVLPMRYTSAPKSAPIPVWEILGLVGFHE